MTADFLGDPGVRRGPMGTWSALFNSSLPSCIVGGGGGSTVWRWSSHSWSPDSDLNMEGASCHSRLGPEQKRWTLATWKGHTRVNWRGVTG